MEQPLPPDRAKICSKCKEFLLLFPYIEENERMEVEFNVRHRNHMVVIIPIKELDLTQYKRFEKDKLIK